MYLLDQPLLMMVGDHADTNYMSEQAFELAITTKEKELYYLKDATHIQTYYKESVVKEAIEKLDIFYKINDIQYEFLIFFRFQHL